jgi:23S rRNA (uracil1939-C5)-methyltransferase
MPMFVQILFRELLMEVIERVGDVAGYRYEQGWLFWALGGIAEWDGEGRYNVTTVWGCACGKTGSGALGDETFELQLDNMAHGGSALGRRGKQTVFVPYTIPGERILARVVQDKGRVAFAEGVTLLEASADRVFPRCPHFGPGKCGRCQWQHIAYPAQLLLKQDVLADQLERIGGFTDAEVRPVIPSPVEWGYNYHMTLVADAEGRLGFQRSTTSQDGGDIFPISECHILHPDLLALYQSLNMEGLTGIQKLRLQMGGDGALMLILTTGDDEAPELVTDLPTSINLLLENTAPVNLIGELYLQYNVAGRLFRVTAGSAFRPNVAQVENLTAEVLAALDLRGDEAVLDLYAGVGLFSAFIAESAGIVTLVESSPSAADDADFNLSDLENVDILEGAVEDVLSDLDEPYDAAVIDPPPDGLSTAALDGLGAARIPRLVYASSDPATLARDGKRLAAQGYRLVYAQPIDLAPQTYYIDTVALFERR